MTLQQLRYILAISQTGSVTQAAAQLYANQPNVSRSIKELEKELGVTLFQRGAKGMEPTAQAAPVLQYAQSILQQMDELEALYHPSEQSLQFCLAAPHSGYIARAFAHFLQGHRRGMDVRYLEMSTQAALDAVTRGEAQMAVIRYQPFYDDYFQELFTHNRLACKLILRFETVVLMSEAHPLAGEKTVRPAQLAGYTQIINQAMQEQVNQQGRVLVGGGAQSRVRVQDRASQYELLKGVAGSYVWAEPLAQSELTRRGLVQKRCAGTTSQDVAVWRTRFGLGPTGQECLEALELFGHRQAQLLPGLGK